MKCVTPLVRIWNKGYPDDYRIIPKSRVAQQLDECANYLSINKRSSKYDKYDFQEIPCGKCYACRLTYSAEWATRIMLEKEYYSEDECYFITLTYDDDHLPVNDSIDYNGKTYRNDGTWNGTLVKNDIQKFIKRIRRRFPNKNIKYLLCGEYGNDNLRPHYHIAVLGLPLTAEGIYDIHVDNRFHKEHFKHTLVSEFWDKGIHDIGFLEWSNAAYVARYCMKKVGDSWSKEEWAKLGKIPEFVTMSRDIARRYYEDHKDEIWKTDTIVMKTVMGNVGHVKPPKRFLTICEKEDPETAAHIKASRAVVAMKLDENNDSDYSDLEKLLISYDNLKTKNSMLKREL